MTHRRPFHEDKAEPGGELISLAATRLYQRKSKAAAYHSYVWLTTFGQGRPFPQANQPVAARRLDAEIALLQARIGLEGG